MLRIMDMNKQQKDIQPGLRIRSFSKSITRLGTVITVDPDDDDFCVIYWDGRETPRGGWYDNDSECEVVLDDQGKPLYISLPADMPNITIANLNANCNMTGHWKDWDLPRLGYDWISNFGSAVKSVADARKMDAKIKADTVVMLKKREEKRQQDLLLEAELPELID